MSWAEKWSLLFHLEKCELIRVTNKKNPLITAFKMSDHVLKTVEEEKYLGVISETYNLEPTGDRQQTAP